MADSPSELNPFESSNVEQTSTNAPTVPFSRIIFPLLITGVLVGAGLGLAIVTIPNLMLLTPAIVWIGALAILLTVFRKQFSSRLTNLGLSIALTVPAYVLYVPACGFGASLLQGVVGGPSLDRYWPSNYEVVIASAISFCIIFVLFAAIVRRVFRPKIETGESP